jgi:hypothetical protein
MTTSTIHELIGYTGSALIVVSLAMSSVIRLRVVNLIGALVFALYGVLIGSVPIVITNVIIIAIDAWYLRRDLATRDVISVVPVSVDDGILETFMARHGDDVRTYHVHHPVDRRANVRLVMLREDALAGAFLGAGSGDDLEVLVDYVTPAFRDLRTGQALYGDGGHRFGNLGFRTLSVAGVGPRHREYFTAMGFVGHDDGQMTLVVADG